jgi:phospholipase D-like protein
MDERRKKRWSEMSPRQRAFVVFGGIAELILTTLALRDLRRRPKAEVRGWKIAWRLALFVQPFGPPLYFLFGRRPSTG